MSVNIPMPDIEETAKPLTRETLAECWENTTNQYEAWRDKCAQEYSADLANIVLDLQVKKLRQLFSSLTIEVGVPHATTALWKCCKAYDEFIEVMPEANERYDEYLRNRKEIQEREERRVIEEERKEANKPPLHWLGKIDDILREQYSLRTITAEDMVITMRSLIPADELRSRYFDMIYYATYKSYEDNNSLFLKCRDECLNKQYKSNAMRVTVEDYLKSKCGDDLQLRAIEKDKLLEIARGIPEYKDVDDEIFLQYKAVIVLHKFDQEKDEQERQRWNEIQANLIADLEAGELYSTSRDRLSTRFSTRRCSSFSSNPYKTPSEDLREKATPEVLAIAERVMEQNKKLYAELDSLKRQQQQQQPQHQQACGTINFGGNGRYSQDTRLQLPMSKIMAIICVGLAVLFLLIDKLVEKNFFPTALGFIAMAIGLFMPASRGSGRPTNVIIIIVGFICVLFSFII